MERSQLTGSKARLAAGCLVVLLGAAVALGWLAMRGARPAASAGPATATATLPPTAAPTPAVTSAFPAVPELVDGRPLPARAELDYARLLTAALPALDPVAAAVELGGATPGESATAAPYALGDRATFQTLDGPREAELVYVDDLAAYWVESGLRLDAEQLAAAAARLRERAYPLLSATFGDVARPGIDGDPRFHVLHHLGPADAELGYFSDKDELPRWLRPDSNEREMVTMNMAWLTPDMHTYDGTLVHEVQHLIQWNLDPNEDTWFNEGLSQVAETLVGLDTVDTIYYREQPYIRFDRWPAGGEDASAHYAGSYLYLLYFWEQAGDAALSELARHPANGLAAVRAVLAGYRPDLSWEEFSGDWAAAVYLDGATSDPRYSLAHAVDLGPLFLANRARQLPFEATAALDQMAMDVIDLDFSGPAVISFAGDTAAALVDAPPAGDAFWFAPPANNGRAQLTAEVDLSGLDAATLEFAVWHDLEPGYDYAYLSASTDGGQTWQRLSPRRPVAGEFGAAWNGTSAGWQPEAVSLDGYAGGRLQLRFDVVTDFRGLGRGFAVSAPAIRGLATQPIWRGEGFVATGATLPQRWELRLIRDGATPQVVRLTLEAANRGQWTVDLGPDGGALVVMPLTPLAAAPADYWLRVTR